MKTLTTHHRELERRLATLTPADSARWGTMSPHQMLCHLADACRMALGERRTSSATGLFHWTLLKRLALRAPVPWGQGYPTRPELDQTIDGTPPVDFELDRTSVRSLLARLAGHLPHPPPPHPYLRSHDPQRLADLGLPPHGSPSPPVRTIAAYSAASTCSELRYHCDHPGSYASIAFCKSGLPAIAFR